MLTTLKNGCAEAAFDTLGGEMVSYKMNGREYVWCGDPAYWSGHAPVLFPIVCALVDNKVRIGGKQYEIKTKHGFARKSEFELLEAKEGHAVYRLKSNAVTLAQYPFDFELYMTHDFDEKGFSTTYTVKNKDEKTMYFCLGGHPGFTVDGSLEDYKLVFEKEENSDLYYTDQKSLFTESYKIPRRIEGREFEPRYDDFDVDAIFAKDLKSRKVKLVKKADGSGIEFDFTGFPVLVLWTPPKKKAPFICLEQWIGLPAYIDETGNMEDRPFVIKLDPGKEYGAGFKVKLI